jgi:hypothetical protein
MMEIAMPDTDRLSDLEINEALIYVRERPDTPAADAEAVSGLPWGPTLRKVEISDAELDRLRRQVGWIAGRLAATEDVDETFAVDAVTLHVGLTASGSFVWASAGVNVAVEVMWRRKPNG